MADVEALVVLLAVIISCCGCCLFGCCVYTRTTMVIEPPTPSAPPLEDYIEIPEEEPTPLLKDELL